MKQVNFNGRFFSARVGWLVIGIGLFFLIIITRLVEIQLFRGQFFMDLANDNRYFTVQIPAERGIFLDRYQQPLVWNKRTYLKADEPTELHSTLSPISHQEALELMATASGQVRYGLNREYHFPFSLSHVLGYVGPVTREDLIADSSLKVSDMIGKLGLEKTFDQQLRGQAGEEIYEINALGEIQRLISKKDTQAGQNITTSLDPYLSTLALEALNEQTGSVIIMDAHTGEILTLISSPSFDANIMSIHFTDLVLEKQRQQQVQEFFDNPSQIFFNRSVSGTYPPGSVFKLVTALGGLEGEAVNQDTTVVDEGILKVGEYEYTNWYYTQYGRTEGEISLQRALARSNDIFFYKVAEWLGPNQLAEFARLLGFGQPTGVELGGEARGIVPDPAWKERVIGEPWYLGNTFHMGIGQGDIAVTPLQISQMTQAITNHGTLCQPTLIKQGHGDCGELGLNEDHLEIVLAGMLDVCSSGGTAYQLFEHNELYRSDELDAQQQIKNGAVAGKTGTAEFGGADERGYRNTHAWLTAVIGTTEIKSNLDDSIIDEVEAEDREVEGLVNRQAWLEAIKQQPNQFPDKLVITVLVESDEDNPYKEGSDDAGAVVKQIIDWMYGR